LGHETTYAYDHLHRPMSVINANSETTSFTYDAVGTFDEGTNHLTGVANHRKYDSFGNLTGETNSAVDLLSSASPAACMTKSPSCKTTPPAGTTPASVKALIRPRSYLPNFHIERVTTGITSFSSTERTLQSSVPRQFITRVTWFKFPGIFIKL
jgi:hypothetical protein